MKKHLKTLWIVAVSLVFSSCGNTPEGMANEWCTLNRQIESANTDTDLKNLTKRAIELEEEIRNTYGEDAEAMSIIYKITDECD